MFVSAVCTKGSSAACKSNELNKYFKSTKPKAFVRPTQSFIRDTVFKTNRKANNAQFTPSAGSNSQPILPDPSYSTDGDDATGPTFLGLNFQDLYYGVNVTYWGLLLISIFIGNPFLTRITHFEIYTTTMFLTSCIFAAWFCFRWFVDVRNHYKSEERKDIKGVMRYGWNSLFWLGFVLWYAAPISTKVTDYTGTPGAICCIFGLALAVSAALHVGMWSFMGEPQVPRRLLTTGPYALLRHPQALGNMLFLIGFSLAGGAIYATAAFSIAFVMYTRTVIPREEAMLRKQFGSKYSHYEEKVPMFAWALWALLAVEVFLMWRYAPFAISPHEVRPMGFKV